VDVVSRRKCGCTILHKTCEDPNHLRTKPCSSDLWPTAIVHLKRNKFYFDLKFEVYQSQGQILVSLHVIHVLLLILVLVLVELSLVKSVSVSWLLFLFCMLRMCTTCGRQKVLDFNQVKSTQPEAIKDATQCLNGMEFLKLSTYHVFIVKTRTLPSSRRSRSRRRSRRRWIIIIITIKK